MSINESLNHTGIYNHFYSWARLKYPINFPNVGVQDSQIVSPEVYEYPKVEYVIPSIVADNTLLSIGNNYSTQYQRGIFTVQLFFKNGVPPVLFLPICQELKNYFNQLQIEDTRFLDGSILEIGQKTGSTLFQVNVSIDFQIIT